MCKSAIVTVITAGFINAYAQITTSTGVTIPKDKMIVFLFMGNSNMNGVDTKRDTSPLDRTWCHRLKGDRTVSGYHESVWAPAISPIYIYGDNGGMNGGMAVPILRTLAQAYPGYHFGGCELSQYSVNPRWFWEGSDNYKTIINTMKPFVGKVTFAGVIYEQIFELDELERKEGYPNPYQVSWYAEDMKKLIASVRKDLSAPDMKLILGEACWTGAKDNDPINLQIRSLVTWDPAKVASVSASGISHYNYSHYNYEGYYTFAGRVRDIMQSKGWLPASTFAMGNVRNSDKSPRVQTSRDGILVEAETAGTRGRIIDARGRVLRSFVITGRTTHIRLPVARTLMFVVVGTGSPVRIVTK